MPEFIEELSSIADCLDRVTETLSFPWSLSTREVELEKAVLERVASDLFSPEPVPVFTRSLRDGYALNHANTTGASSGAPVFLRLTSEITMGRIPESPIASDEAAYIPTGGILPSGADAVVMIEDTASAGDWIEIRKAVQRGENLIFSGEDVAMGERLLGRGEMIDASKIGLLSTLGVCHLDVCDLKVGILSTGDEIVPAATSPLPDGFVRDANSYIVRSLLEQYGFPFCHSFGIARDNEEELKKRVLDAMQMCDVLLLSGGSSVGARDHTFRILASLEEPGLLTRGLNMSPGKPTIVSGERENRKLVVGLPGHPLSCAVAGIFVLIPLLLRMVGLKTSSVGKSLLLPLGEDVRGKTGVDEFIPMRIENGRVFPLAAKSGYVSAMKRSDGFLRLFPDMETKREGETAHVWIW